MVLAAIVINQTGKTPGLPSQSRDDLNLGVLVYLTNNDNTGVISWFWEFVSKPVGSSATISGAALPSASFVPDVRGSYLVKLTVDTSPSNPATDTRIAAVKTTFLGIRKPATSERKEFDALDGWSAAHQAMIDAIDNDVALNLKRNGSNQPTADINWGGQKITNLGGLQNEGALRLGETSNPSAVLDKGFLYAKDDSGDTELFYMDDGGVVVQITKDGQLDIVSLQGDSLPTKTANGFLKRNSGNTAWEEVVYGTGSNTVCQGNDSRLSDSRTPTGTASGQLGGTYPSPDVRGIRETNGPTLLTLGAILNGQILVRDGSTIIGSSTARGGKVKVRVDDIADGYLHDKLLTGSGLSFAIGNPGGNETLTIDAYGEAKVSSADTTFGYLFDKLREGPNITLTKQSPGGNEKILVTCLATGGKVKVRVDDLADGYLHNKLLTGPNLNFSIANPGGNETLTFDAYGQPTKSVYVDGYRSDNYVANGSVFRPYKTIGAALSAITDNSSSKRYELQVAAGTYNEQVTLKPYVSIHGASRLSTVITYSSGHTIIAGAALASGSCRLSSLSITNTNAGGSHGINGTSGANLELFDVYVSSTKSDALYANAVGIFLIGFTTCVSLSGIGLYAATSGSVFIANVYIQGTVLDMHIDTGGEINLDSSCQFGTGYWRIDGNFYNYSPARFVWNDSTVPGYSVSQALEYLDANSTFDVLTLIGQSGDPDSSINDGYLYNKGVVDAFVELFYMDTQSNPVQITSDGQLNTDGYSGTVTIGEITGFVIENGLIKSVF